MILVLRFIWTDPKQEFRSKYLHQILKFPESYVNILKFDVSVICIIYEIKTEFGSDSMSSEFFCNVQHGRRYWFLRMWNFWFKPLFGPVCSQMISRYKYWNQPFALWDTRKASHCLISYYWTAKWSYKTFILDTVRFCLRLASDSLK